MLASESDSQERSLIEAAFEQEGSGEAAETSSSGSRFDPLENPRPILSEIGGYDIIREIHQGGQGVVYEALQKTTNRRVAIKVLRHGRLANKRERARFEREARILAQLNDPRIVAIHHTGQAYGGDYFVMDFVDGIPVDSFIEQSTMSVRERLELFADIASAVEQAHLRGFIHRDLKPSNILVDEQGQPHILDFGLAKIAAEADDVTRARDMTITGQFVGSLPWASPEQADGTPELIDLRSDVYSLGVVLYQLLTGRFPYSVVGKMREVLGHILETEPIKPRTIRKGIDDEIETIVLKCLAKAPERRYQSAGELARDIGHYLADEPIEAKRDSVLYVLRKQMHRHRVPLAVAIGFIGLLVASSVVAWTLYLRSQESLRDSYVARAHSTRLSGRAGQRFDTLDALAKAATIRPSIELRNEAISATALADVRTIKQWVVEGPPSWSEAFFSHDVAYYVLLNQDGELSLRRVASDEELLHIEGYGFRPGNPTFSPDGSLVAIATESAYEIWAVSTAGQSASVPVLKIPRQRRNSGVPDFSGNSREFAVAVSDGIRIYDVQSGTFRLIEYGQHRHNRVCFHPQAPVIATWSMVDTNAVIRNEVTGDVVRSFSHPEAVRSLAWSPDGALLATGCGNAAVYVWDVRTGQRKFMLRGHPGTPAYVAFNSSGNLLMSAGWGNSTSFWDVHSGKRLLSMHGNGIAFEGDSNRFVHVTRTAGRETFKILDFENGTVQHLIGYDPSDERDIRWVQVACHRGGRILADAGTEGVRLWDSALGIQIGQLTIGQTSTVLWSRSGDWLISSGVAGAFRWPVKNETGVVRVGPPERLWGKIGSGATCIASLSGDDTKLAISVGQSRAAVLDLDNEGHSRYIGEHFPLHFVALNHNGSRLATSTWHGDGVKVWDVASGGMVYELPVASATRVRFSPDGAQIITSNGAENCIWNAETGKRIHLLPRAGTPGLPGAIAFSPDHSILALPGQNETTLFYKASSMELLANLTSPRALKIGQSEVAFTPNGTRLVTSSGRFHIIDIWDLRAIREQLTAMHLDWDLPDYPPALPIEIANPLRVEVDLGELATQPSLSQRSTYRSRIDNADQAAGETLRQ